MPEGDAIFRTARTLNRALAGAVVTRFESVFPALTRVEVVGRTVERVDAAGKHVLMRFSGDLVLRTHMRMNGSWHIYRAGERWRRPGHDMRIVVGTERFEAVAFTVPVAEWLRAGPARGAVGSIERQEDLRQMGPDLLGDTFDEDEAVRRVHAHADEEIADVLLNQRVAAGIGNVYKSEVLFIRRVSPFARAKDVSDDEVRELLRTARKLLVANVSTLGGGITTYIGFQRGRGRDDADRRYVYGRARKPCRRCATPIRVRAQGPYARLTYWCPACQPSPA